MNEQPVTVTSRRGQKLYGILHSPEATSALPRRTGIHLVNAGLKGRVAPHRLYVKIARKLASMGFHVARFDSSGLGESEGDLPDLPVVHLWSAIQRGCNCSDVIDINDFFIEHCSLKHLALIGSCGGAITALLASRQDARIEKLLLVDLPVLFSAPSKLLDTYFDSITPGMENRAHMMAGLFRKLLNPQRLLRAVFRAASRWSPARLQFWKTGTGASVEGGEISHPEFNHGSWESCCNFLSQQKDILFLCAERGYDTRLFEQFFAARYLTPGNPYEKHYEIFKVKDANHIYTLIESQGILINKITGWLSEQYALTRRRVPS